jgi:tryptophan synthase alpha chain
MSITRLENRIATLLDQNEKLFIPYVMCGDGGFDKTEKLLRHLENSGASIIEIGIPFSDPIADGPTIQAAGQRALDDGVSLKKIIKFLKEAPPANEVPRVIMSYLNPIYQYDLEKFFQDITEAQISGLIIPDLPFEEYDMLHPLAQKYQIALIPLVAPSTGPERLKMILGKASGFVYTVTVNGTTGKRREFSPTLLDRFEMIREITNMPVVAGFGISNRNQISALGKHCEGVVVGSKIVELAFNDEYEAITDLMQS